MKFKEISRSVEGVPFISTRKARYLYSLIERQGIANVLELGIGHGAATCYIAAALDELGGGKVTAVDLREPHDDFDPTAEELVARSGLEEYVDIVRMETGYTWFLHDMIARQTTGIECEPCYDLCIIDGPKNWTIDGAAFFMVDKLLVDGGRIIFDDYNWTYAEADTRRDATDGITHRRLSDAELTTSHIKEVVDLLVTPHPDYSRVTVLDNGEWVLAEKSVGAPRKSVEFDRMISLEEMVARAATLFRRRGSGAVADAARAGGNSPFSSTPAPGGPAQPRRRSVSR